MKEFNIFEEILALQNEGVTAFSELLKFSGKGNPKTDIKDIPKPPQKEHISDLSTFFKGCRTLESLNMRYKDLIKIYHPDSGNGNDKVFIEITEEYERLKPSFEQ